MNTARSELSARDRLLAAANALFYEEGVHTVGIDRVIEHAGVAKASLYSTFGSKEELVRAYVEARAAARLARMEQRISLHTGAREKILSIFELVCEIVADPEFRGCAFINASIEGPRGPSKVRQACADARRKLLELFTGLSSAAGAANAPLFGRRLALLYDGAVAGAPLEAEPALAASEARAIVEELLDALPKKGKGRASHGRGPDRRSRTPVTRKPTAASKRAR